MNNKYNKILNTAIELFIENGIKKTTMDELAENANVSKVTIYKYFGDKDSLYYIVGKSILDNYNRKIEFQMDHNIDVDIKIANIMDVLVDLIITDKLTLCKNLAKLNYKLKNDYDKFYSKYRTSIIELILICKNQGIIKKEVKDEFVFNYIDMGLSYFENNIAYRKKMVNDEQFKQEFMSFLLSNIFIDKGYK